MFVVDEGLFGRRRRLSWSVMLRGVVLWTLAVGYILAVGFVVSRCAVAVQLGDRCCTRMEWPVAKCGAHHALQTEISNASVTINGYSIVRSEVAMPLASTLAAIGGVGQAASGLAALGGAAGLFGGKESSNIRLEPFSVKMALRQQGLAEDAFYRGFQHRVADAKAAGLHPLFALGASVPSIPGAAGVIGAQNASSTGLQRARLAMDAFDQMSRFTEARIRKTEAETALTLSEAKRAELALLAAPAGMVPGHSPNVTEPIEASRDFSDQLMRTEGPITIPEWDERLAGAVAGGWRDTVRSMQARRAMQWHKREMRKLSKAKKTWKRRQTGSFRMVPDRRQY